MSYDFARERHDAYEADADLIDDLRYEAEQEALEAEAKDFRNGPSAYRCTDRMCGATDCSHCYPVGDGKEHDDDDALEC